MLDTQLLSALQKLNSTIYKTVERDLKKYSLNTSEFGILLHLKSAGRSKTQTIGEVASITSGAITYFSKKFLKKGLITRIQDKTDKRVFWLDLTKKGNIFLNDVLIEHTKYVNEVFSIFDDLEKERFFKTLRYFTKELKKEERKNYENKGL